MASREPPSPLALTPFEEGCVHVRQKSKRLAKRMDCIGPCRLPLVQRGGELERLIRAIVGQQLSPAAATTIFKRLLALFEGELPAASELLAIPSEGLRRVGLSAAKIQALQDLCRRVESGLLDFDALHLASDEQVIAVLSEIRGVGVWTAQMFLMFHLGRLNVWPTGDLAMRKGLMELKRLKTLPTPREAMRHGEPFTPYRSIACWYLWQPLPVSVESLS